ncbi:Uncharacterised protein [Bordetella pertussis]|nr:Uncharacterised protein [Bordetella pertussis]
MPSCCSSRSASMLWPHACAATRIVLFSLSVSNLPGRMLLMVTPRAAISERARPAIKPVRPERAPLDRPSVLIGAFTAVEVMLTMRPKPRACMPSTVALISAMGVSMLASIALIQSSRSQSWYCPGGGPPALVTTMSKSGPGPPGASSAACLPGSVIAGPGFRRPCAARTPRPARRRRCAR